MSRHHQSRHHHHNNQYRHQEAPPPSTSNNVFTGLTGRYEGNNNAGSSNRSVAQIQQNAGGIEYQDDALSSIHSDDDENYLRKDKCGKISNYFRAVATGSQKHHHHHQGASGVGAGDIIPLEMAPSSSSNNNGSDRLDRLESMVEKLCETMVATKNKSNGNMVAPPSHHHPQQQLLLHSTREKKDSGGVGGTGVTFLLEPRNHQFTTSMWISKLQEVAITNDCNEQMTISYMESQMTGLMKAWYKHVTGGGDGLVDITWPEWKILITKTFPDNYDFVTTLKRLVTRIKQADETVINYYYSKMYLIEACRITGEDAVACLIDGLNNQEIQAEAKMQNYLTPETLYTQLLINLSNYTLDYTPPPPPQPQIMIQQPETEEETSGGGDWPQQEFSLQNDIRGGDVQEQFEQQEQEQHQHHHHHHQQQQFQLQSDDSIPALMNYRVNNPIPNPKRHYEEKPSVHARLGERGRGGDKRRRPHSRISR